MWCGQALIFVRRSSIFCPRELKEHKYAGGALRVQHIYANRPRQCVGAPFPGFRRLRLVSVPVPVCRETLSARSRRLQTRSRHGAYLFLPLHLSLLSDPFTFRSPTLSPWDFALFSAERRDRPSAANNSAFRCAVYFSLAATISPLSGRHAGCDRGAAGPADLPAPLWRAARRDRAPPPATPRDLTRQPPRRLSELSATKSAAVRRK